MSLLRRSDRSAGRISAFWDWWVAEGRALAEAVIAQEAAEQRFAKAMASRVRAIGSLAWSLNAGEISAHALVISAEGDPEQLALARRTVLAAPQADETWSYVDARPPVLDPESIVIGVPGADHVELSQVSVSARLAGATFDVAVFHPAFSDLPEQVRAQVALLALDAALGEVDTELWLGEVRPAEVPPLDGFGLTALRAVVRDLKRDYMDQDGRPRWVQLQAESPAGPVQVTARVPLHPMTAPLLDTYVAAVLPYLERTDEGLPYADSLERLRTFEGQLESTLGPRGMVVAHQSVAGVRTLHVYVDSTAGLVPVIRDLAAGWAEGPATVHDQRDPGWHSVRHFRA